MTWHDVRAQGPVPLVDSAVPKCACAPRSMVEVSVNRRSTQNAKIPGQMISDRELREVIGLT